VCHLAVGRLLVGERRRLDPASAPGRTPDDDRSLLCAAVSTERHEQEQDRRNGDDDPDPWLHRSLLLSLIDRCLPEVALRHTPGEAAVDDVDEAIDADRDETVRYRVS
jgi:hypothetical protein